MKRILLFPGTLFVLIFLTCTFSNEKQADPETQFNTHCGSCHLAPDISHIPKSIWEENVLPEMAARLGYKYNNYNPLAKNSMEENLYIRLSKVYPDVAKIDSTTWKQIHDYILARAPETISIDTLRKVRHTHSNQFRPSAIALDQDEISTITYIEFHPPDNQFIIGNGHGTFFTWPQKDQLNLSFKSPVMSYLQKEKELYVTEVGFLNPSEKPVGSIYRIHDQVIDTLARELHRPVYTEVTDLDGDGKDEVLICEFGNLTGKLSILIPSDSGFERKTLLPIPGIIKVEIADLNSDGKKDIVVLASQGNEGIYILYGKGNLHFSVNHAIKLNPEYGSSWFNLIDYNKDDHLDIVLVNGDNADYTIFPKPYHGIRLFLNDGKNNFSEEWFYPIYGATKVLTEDYDQDGDYDFVVAAYFPDYEYNPNESIVFLENKSAEEFLFESHIFEESVDGRWMVMDHGDYDEDGDYDIILGSFMLPIDKKYMPIMNNWREKKADLLLLENTLK